jgi:TIGR03009 family protein
MRPIVWIVSFLAVATWLISVSPTAAQDGEPKAAAPTAGAAKAKVAAPDIDPTGQRMEQLLRLWAKQSTRLKTLDVKIKREDKAADHWGDVVRYEGRAMFKTPNRAFIDFQKVGEGKDRAKTLVPHERIICTGTEIWDFLSLEKQVFVFQIDKKDRERALEEGPLPFLFNFQADEAKERYSMKLWREDPESYYVIVMAKQQIDKDRFSKAVVRLDRKFLLPLAIVLFDPAKHGAYQRYDLSDHKPNGPINDVNFEPKKPANWKMEVVRNNPVRGNAGGPRGALAPRQPALRRGMAEPNVR